MTLVESIFQHMSSDCEDDSDRLRTLYENASAEQKKTIDDALTCICGYSLATLIGQAGAEDTDAKEEEGLQPLTDMPDPVIRVRPVGEDVEWSEWRISQNLTDRRGDFNFFGAEYKPLGALQRDKELLARLRAQMCDEICFIVRKDGNYGILYEIEFSSIESDGEDAKADSNDSFFTSLRPHAEVIRSLRDGLQELCKAYPSVLFAIPEEEHVAMNRAAAWAFVPDGALSPEQRESLGRALLAL